MKNGWEPMIDTRINTCNNRPLVSVIIPCHNEEETIGECIESLLTQTYKKVEIIVVDDASADNTYKISSKYPINVIQLNKNCGPASARNIGANNANGHILVFVEGDSKYSPDYIETIIKPFSHHSVGGSICGQRIVWSDKNNTVVKYQNLRWKAKTILKKEKRYPVVGAWAFRKEVFDKLGGYDKTLRYGEDLDLFYRMKKAGYKSEWDPGAYIYHKDPDTLTDLIRYVWKGALNINVFENRWGKPLPTIVYIEEIILTIKLAFEEGEIATAFSIPFIVFCLFITRRLGKLCSRIKNNASNSV